MNKDYLVSELDALLPEREKTAYILKERPTDKDLAMIQQLVQKDSNVKDFFLELYLMDQKSRRIIVHSARAILKELKR
ncbi:hypothetical protein LS684_19060 [Cytobacillus spongiae]|uniref:hypothetical protein n=1 Tax=Cytobacillus spongiae TaxID=2901381 RepID=UPI001F3A06BF|nr:hypothetical protein [Cytobacillus spongiae]UII55700.1 hypothetical protein LS684_19060 [Cytobacillus spongiae]